MSLAHQGLEAKARLLIHVFVPNMESASCPMLIMGGTRAVVNVELTQPDAVRLSIVDKELGRACLCAALHLRLWNSPFKERVQMESDFDGESLLWLLEDVADQISNPLETVAQGVVVNA